MRIVGGEWAGTDLTSPGGRVRPTAEELRVQWMRLVEAELEGASILDLYAGTGAVGLEAMSRGAERADFVENNPAALHSLKANVAALRVTDRTRIFKHDALRWVHRLRPDTYDLAFADPPYGSRQADRLVEDWRRLGYAPVLVVEHASDHRMPKGGRTHAFDASSLTVYRAAGAPRHGTRNG